MISQPFPPRLQPGTFRTLRFVRHLPAWDWDITVLTVKEGAVPPTCRIDPDLLRMVPDLMEVHRVPVWKPYDRTTAFIKRLVRRSAETIQVQGELCATSPQVPSPTSGLSSLRDLLLKTPDSEVGWILPAIWRGLKLIRTRRPEIMMVTTPPHSAQLIAVALKLLTGVPMVLDFRDPWARAPWDAEVPWMRRQANQTCESFCVGYADHVILNTDALRDEFRAYYPAIPEARFSTITNGYDPALRQVIDEMKSQRRHNQEARAWRLVHAGQLYGQRDPRALFHALRELKHEGMPIQFDNYGSLEDSARINALIANCQVEDCVKFHAPLPHAEMLRTLAQSDAILVLQQGTEIQIPSKVFESLLFDQPLLGLVGQGAARQMIEDYQLGVVAAPDQVDAIKSAIRKMGAGQSSDLRRKADALRDFHAATLSKQLHHVLCNVLGVDGDVHEQPSVDMPHPMVESAGPVSLGDSGQITGLS